MQIGPYSSTPYNFPWSAAKAPVSELLPYVTPPTPGGGPTLGQVPDNVQDALGGRLSSNAFMVASLLGSGLGGALVGYIASGRKQGALTGGAFVLSLAALSDSLLAYREEKPVASTLFALSGMMGLGFVVLRFAGERGHHGLSGLGQVRQPYKVKYPDGTVRHTDAHSPSEALERVEYGLGYKPKGKPEIYLEYQRSSGRSYEPAWRQLQGVPKGPASGFGREKTKADINARIAWENWAARDARKRGHEAIAQGHELSAHAYAREKSRRFGGGLGQAEPGWPPGGAPFTREEDHKAALKALDRADMRMNQAQGALSMVLNVGFKEKYPRWHKHASTAFDEVEKARWQLYKMPMRLSGK